MKILFIITTIMKPGAVAFHGLINNFQSKTASETMFEKYEDAEKFIKNTMPRGIYQIQKVFVIE